MGYDIEYSAKLKIKRKNCQRALEMCNHLHSDEMLVKHAAGCYGNRTDPINKRYYYNFVPNPSTPYTSLSDVFQKWCVIWEVYDVREEKDSSFYIDGKYIGKRGAQSFLLSYLAPVLEDTAVYAKGEDDEIWAWIIKDGVFRRQDLTIDGITQPTYDDREEDEEE